MPLVPGTKVWIRNDELEDAVDRMFGACPPERIVIARDLTESTLKRCRQARSNFSKVYRFIILRWFNEEREVGTVINKTSNAR